VPAVERIIVVGGSMGAYDVVKTLCKSLPADLQAAVCIVLHLRPDSRNIFAGSLDNLSGLPVSTAKDGDPLEGGHIYVAPGDHHLLIIEDGLRLGRGPRENMSRPAIDPLFRSAAVTFGSRVIGVVLSGYLNLAAVKQCGGSTIVQDPSDAKAQDMPVSALQSSDVDYRGSAEDLAAMLSEILRTPPGPTTPAPPELMLEVDIALGRPCTTDTLVKIADVSPLSCPACGGVLSQIRAAGPLRYRCQVGHAYTAEILNKEQEPTVDEAMRVALRIIEERVTLLERMARDDRANGRVKSAAMTDDRLDEYRGSADLLRQTLIGR
jgi:two-component system, chemotaxis family, protein-glutamate methylesterase/glutaminase